MPEGGVCGGGRVKVLFYAEFRQAAKRKEIEFEVSEPVTVRQLLNRVAERVPALEAMINPAVTQQEWGQFLLVLVDGKIVGLNGVVGPGETAQLMPPASGG
jgi:molybdopterin converting factor small subunit